VEVVNIDDIEVKVVVVVVEGDALSPRFQTRLGAEVSSEGSAAWHAEMTGTILRAKAPQLGVRRWRAMNSAEVSALLPSSFILEKTKLVNEVKGAYSKLVRCVHA
jgi:hypothetical protein